MQAEKIILYLSNPQLQTISIRIPVAIFQVFLFAEIFHPSVLVTKLMQDDRYAWTSTF